MSDFHSRPQPTSTPQPSGVEAFAPSQLSTLVTTLQQIVRAIAANTAAINSKFPNWVTAPVTTNDPGTAGQVAYDGTYFYVCVATNTWGRVLLDFAF